MSRPRIVAGFGRSGTTWVQDVVAESNSLRTVFEPLHPTAVSGARELALGFLNKDDRDQALREFLEPYLSGSFRSIWAEYRVHPNWLIPWRQKPRSVQDFRNVYYRIIRSLGYIRRYRPQKERKERVTKFVRANMMLSWLKENFDARIVFVIRHPAPVVLSQLRAMRSWDPYSRIDRYREQQRLVDALDERIRALLYEELDPVGALTLAWCVENSIAMRQARESNILTVHYEHLLERGDSEWKKVLSALELPNMPDGSLVSQPSQQAWGGHANDPESIRRYASWMERIDSEVAESIAYVLSKSGITTYRIDRAGPADVD